ncbi:MAG: 16S rRNA (guanine(966)-N(2))-methyltransferase RsmD [Gemmatimonadaceae bacterium]|nr:16S rRNA (guanine(966)-N(2))-methyltransferase RsmD [Gemmatimonadaceae bacterium]
MAELRIVAGAWRGRRIKVPPKGVRPTADRVREAWMSIVQRDIPDAAVVDLCAGSGALGLEALSRGAVSCDFVEKDARTLQVLDANIAALGAGETARVHRAEALRFLESASLQVGDAPTWQLAFADPPYREGIAEALAARWLAAPFAAIFGVEHEATLTLPEASGSAGSERRVYGDTALTLYRTTD